MRITRLSRSAANILLLTLFTTGGVGLVLLAYLRLGAANEILVARSQTWNMALPAAEAGIEEALSQLNWQRGKNLTENGWTKISDKDFQKTRALGPDAYYTVTIEDTSPMRITSVGYVRAPLSSNYISRTITVAGVKTNVVFTKAMIAKKHIRCGKGTLIDSYDSTRTNYSTKGLYDPAKRKDNASVAATSNKKNAVKVDKTKIYGDGATSPKGNFEFKNGGTLGDKTWVDGGKTGGQPGKITADFSYDFPPVKLPDTTWVPAVGGTWPSGKGGVSYKYILDHGDWKISGNPKIDKPILVKGDARLYVTGDLKLEENLIITNGGSLILYMAGHKFELKDKAIVGDPTNPTKFQYYGLDSNKEIRLKKKGGVDISGLIYAPRARIKIEGDSDVCGSIVGKCIHLKHDGAFHYDEGINRRGTDIDLYSMGYWRE